MSLSSNTKSAHGTRHNNAGEWRPNENIFPHLPRSMFDRASGALLKMRNDIRIQRYRGINRPMTMTLASLKPPLPARPVPEPPHVPDWLIHEDYALLQVCYYNFLVLFLSVCNLYYIFYLYFVLNLGCTKSARNDIKFSNIMPGSYTKLGSSL